MDTRATVLWSNAKLLFHNHRESTKSCQSPVRLCAAINEKKGDKNASVAPEGKGHLLVPACNHDGFTPVEEAHCSPHLTCTPIGDNCVMGLTKRDHDQFATQNHVKCLLESTFSRHCHDKINRSEDTQVDGVLLNCKCHTHPLVIMDPDKRHRVQMWMTPLTLHGNGVSNWPSSSKPVQNKLSTNTHWLSLRNLTTNADKSCGLSKTHANHL